MDRLVAVPPRSRRRPVVPAVMWMLVAASVVVGRPCSAAVAQAGAEAEWNAVVASYALVRDYSCLYEKQERAISNAELQTMRLSFRKPLDIRLEWLNGRGQVDQTAVYRQGLNGGRLLARRSGLLGSVVGTIRLDVRDARALEDSRHPITEVGLGHLVEMITGALLAGAVKPQALREESLDGRDAYRFEFVASGGAAPVAVPDLHHAVVWVDRSLRLPVKFELVDAQGAMIERHRFKDLRLNVGLLDATFAL